MRYESVHSVPNDEIVGVEYDPGPADEMNNDKHEPIMDSTNPMINTALVSSRDDPRDNIIYNLSVPSTIRVTRVFDVESSLFTVVQLGGDVISEPVQPENDNIARPTRNRTQVTRIKIASNKGSTYDHAMVQAMYMTQIAEAAKGKRLSLNMGLKLWSERGQGAVGAELSQIHNRTVFDSQDPNELTWEEKKQAFDSLLFLE